MVDVYNNITDNFQLGEQEIVGDVTTLPAIESNVQFDDLSNGQAIIGDANINMADRIEGLQYQEGIETFGNEGIVNYREPTPITVDNAISSEYVVSPQVVEESLPVQYGEITEVATDNFPLSTQVNSDPFQIPANVIETASPTLTTQVVPYSEADLITSSVPATTTTEAFSFPAQTATFGTPKPVQTAPTTQVVSCTSMPIQTTPLTQVEQISSMPIKTNPSTKVNPYSVTDSIDVSSIIPPPTNKLFSKPLVSEPFPIVSQTPITQNQCISDPFPIASQQPEVIIQPAAAVVQSSPIVYNQTPITTTAAVVQSQPIVIKQTPITATAPVVQSQPIVINQTPITTTTPIVQSQPIVYKQTPITTTPITTTPIVQSQPIVYSQTPIATKMISTRPTPYVPSVRMSATPYVSSVRATPFAPSVRMSATPSITVNRPLIPTQPALPVISPRPIMTAAVQRPLMPQTVGLASGLNVYRPSMPLMSNAGLANRYGLNMLNTGINPYGARLGANAYGTGLGAYGAGNPYGAMALRSRLLNYRPGLLTYRPRLGTGLGTGLGSYTPAMIPASAYSIESFK